MGCRLWALEGSLLAIRKACQPPGPCTAEVDTVGSRRRRTGPQAMKPAEVTASHSLPAPFGLGEAMPKQATCRAGHWYPAAMHSQGCPILWLFPWHL